MSISVEKSWITPIVRQSWVVSGILINKLGHGMVLGMTSCIITALQAPDSEIKIDTSIASWLGTMIGVACLCGCPASYFMKRFGRRKVYSFKNVPAIIGLFLTASASNITYIMIGRFFCGFTIGTTATMGAMVVGEYTSPKYRGMFLILKTACYNLGSLFVHILGNYIHWRTIAFGCLAPFTISLIMALLWPESPYWLAENQRFDESQEAFYWLRGKTEESTREFDLIIKNQQNRIINRTTTETITEFFMKLKKKNFWKPCVILLFTSVMVECGGRHVFPTYAILIIQGMASNKVNPFHYIMILDILITVSAFSSSFLIRILKLRTLLFTSGFISCVSLCLACLSLYLTSVGTLSKTYSWIPISLLCVFFVVVNLSCTTVPLTIVGEIFPIEHRAVGSSVSGYFIGLFVIVAMKVTPFLIEAFNTYGAFAIFAGGLAAALIGLYFMLPETKGRTLQDIDDFFTYGKCRNRNHYDDSQEGKKMLKDRIVDADTEEPILKTK